MAGTYTEAREDVGLATLLMYEASKICFRGSKTDLCLWLGQLTASGSCRLPLCAVPPTLQVAAAIAVWGISCDNSYLTCIQASMHIVNPTI